MAYLLKAVFKDGTEEIVPVWSGALYHEIGFIHKSNPNIKDLILIDGNPSKDECEFWYDKIEKTIYLLPREYKRNRIQYKGE